MCKETKRPIGELTPIKWSVDRPCSGYRKRKDRASFGRLRKLSRRPQKKGGLGGPGPSPLEGDLTKIFFHFPMGGAFYG